MQRGIIRPSSSEYCSPIVLTKRKNGQLRMYVDYRSLNKIIDRVNYPLPLIEDNIDILGDKKYFSLIDLKDGFHHIKVSEESIKYTSFITPFGQYEYLYMPFAIKIGTSVFQKFVNDVLRELITSGDIVGYMYDILVVTKTIDLHFEVLKKLFKLMVHNLKIKT